MVGKIINTALIGCAVSVWLAALLVPCFGVVKFCKIHWFLHLHLPAVQIYTPNSAEGPLNQRLFTILRSLTSSSTQVHRTAASPLLQARADGDVRL